MKLFTILIAALCLGGCASAPFKSLPTSEYVFDGTLALDMLTTADIKHHAHATERNPLLGKTPSDAKIALYGLTAALVHGAITYELTEHGAPAIAINVWEAAGITLEVACTAHNYSTGMRVRF